MLARFSVLRLVALAMLLASGGNSFAQQNAPAPAATATAPAAGATAANGVTTPAPETVSLNQFAEQALNTSRLIEQMTQLAQQPDAITKLKEALPAAEEQARNLRRDTLAMLDDKQTGVEKIRTSTTQWQFLRDQLASQLQQLRDRASALETGLNQLKEEDDRWQALKAQISTVAVPAEAQKTFQKAQNDIAASRKQLTAPLKDLLPQISHWQDLVNLADDNLVNLQQQETSLRRQLLTSMQAPLWMLNSDEFHLNEGTEESIQQQWLLTRHYVETSPSANVIIMGGALATLVLLWRLQKREGLLKVMLESAGLNFTLFERPLSTLIATTVAIALFAYQHPPLLVSTLLALALFIPVVRLGLARLPRSVRPLAWMVSIFFVINSLAAVTESVPALQRLWVVGCAGASLLMCIHLLRKLSLSLERTGWFWRGLRTTLWLSLLSALVACIGGIIGAATLSQFLITGIANSAYAGLCLFVIVEVLVDLCAALLYAPFTAGSHMISGHRNTIIHAVRKLIIFISVLAWLDFALQQFFLEETAIQLIRAIFGKPLQLGSLSVSLGDVVAIIVTIWLSLRVSKFLRFVFMEDVVPRTNLARGVPEAMSTLMHYAIVLIGFVLAIGVAGIDVSKIAFLIGAMGVGIGIGLQDVVNNFTSGLILLFENHIKQGDIIQSSAINGRVLHIGLRSSVVRSFDGAEVIVPNSQLVSAQVINWTHSDQQRRIIIPVGVAYGSVPEKVIATLLDIANNDADVMAEPAPTAFFFNFGPSSLNFELRAWVANGEVLNDVTSRLCSTITNRFRAEGIVMPFPQQDVHVRFVDQANPRDNHAG